ncbi:MAG: hypothetical protein GKR87_11630 [Kiritimatiellae bacterium]|nr:hypothetical protein [Kiritimatiellia bacterium]
MISVWAGGIRSGGNFTIEYESLNSGGISYATNGNIKLEGTLGQSGFTLISTNILNESSQNGFWKAEGSCSLYPARVTDLLVTPSNSIGIMFTVMRSNTYLVVCTENLMDGLNAWTNQIMPPVMAQTGVGSSMIAYEPDDKHGSLLHDSLQGTLRACLVKKLWSHDRKIVQCIETSSSRDMDCPKGTKAYSLGF